MRSRPAPRAVSVPEHPRSPPYLPTGSGVAVPAALPSVVAVRVRVNQVPSAATASPRGTAHGDNRAWKPTKPPTAIAPAITTGAAVRSVATPYPPPPIAKGQ